MSCAPHARLLLRSSRVWAGCRLPTFARPQPRWRWLRRLVGEEDFGGGESLERQAKERSQKERNQKHNERIAKERNVKNERVNKERGAKNERVSKERNGKNSGERTRKARCRCTRGVYVFQHAGFNGWRAVFPKGNFPFHAFLARGARILTLS